VVQVAKSLKDLLTAGNKFGVIDDKCQGMMLETDMLPDAGGRSTLQRWCRDHTVRKTVPNGGSGDWEGLAAYGRQFDGRYQQTIGPSRT